MPGSLFIRSISVTGSIPRDDYISQLPAVKHLQAMGGLRLRRPVTFLVGENGMGKSTLVEAVAVCAGFNPEGGTINFSFSTRASHSDLYRYLRITRGAVRNQDGFFLRAESFYNVASDIDRMDASPGPGRRLIDSYGGISLHEQSHGESFLALVANRFSGQGLYILDEPEAALSPMRLMTLLCHIKDLVDRQSQFIISTHSPVLMTFPGAEIFELSERGIRSVTYRETEHFQITKRFLDAPERMHSVLGLTGSEGGPE